MNLPRHPLSCNVDVGPKVQAKKCSSQPSRKIIATRMKNSTGWYESSGWGLVLSFEAYFACAHSSRSKAKILSTNLQA